MKSAHGYVKISRKFFEDDPWWSEPRAFSKAEAWMDIIQTAAWKPRKFAVGHTVEHLERGEFFASVRFLAQRWHWGKNVVQRWLATAQKAGRLAVQREGQHGTVYLLVNYEKYQNGDETDGTASGTPSGTRAGRHRDATGTKQKQLSSKAVKRSSPKITWLTPFDDAWQARCGGKLTYGQAAKLLRPIVDGLGDAEALARWQRYLAATDPRYCSLKRFAEIHGTYAEAPIVEMTDEIGQMRQHRRRPDGTWEVREDDGSWVHAAYLDGVEVQL